MVAVLIAACSLPAAAQGIFRSGFEYATPALRGGSNLQWFALPAQCGGDPLAVIPSYHEAGVRNTVRGQLIEMRAAGQERVSIGVLHLTPTVPTLDGRINPTILDSSGGQLHPQYVQNIRVLLSDLREAGFAGILFRYFPQGANDPRSWNAKDAARLEDNWGVIAQIEPLLAASGLSYGTDLMVEGMPRADIVELPGDDLIRPDVPANRPWSDYTREIWRRYVQAFGASRSVGFSFVSDTDETRIDARAEHKDYVYTIDGQLVMPAALALDIYGTALRDERWIFERYRKHLVDEGLGAMYWVIAESYYDDPSAARGIAEGMTATGQNVLYLTQWPLQRNAGCDPNVSVAPPIDYANYAGYGF
jgi:hypothetical protein